MKKLIVVFSLVMLSCAPLKALVQSFLPQLVSLTQEAGSKLNQLANRPLTPAQKALLDKAYKALAAASREGAGQETITKAQANLALAAFRAAYEALVDSFNTRELVPGGNEPLPEPPLAAKELQ